jgi:hypothetical protein
LKSIIRSAITARASAKRPCFHKEIPLFMTPYYTSLVFFASS